MIEYCARPKNFENLIFTNIIKIIKDEDILIHLGDVCFGKDSEMHKKYIESLPFKKILVIGNHDRKSNNWYLEHGWDFVCKTFSGKYFGKNILFSHRPHKDIGFDVNIHGHFHNALDRLKEGRFAIEGERERNEQDLAVLTDKHKLLALEFTNYKPVNLESFLEIK